MIWMTLLQAVWGLVQAISLGSDLPTPEERIVLQETNLVRSQHGLPPLSFDVKLMRAARSHAATMAQVQVMSHKFRGNTPAGRAAYFGYQGPIRENIANGYGPDHVVTVAWMNSPPHRANILSPSANIGVGMVWAHGRWWACQVLGN